MRFSWLVQILWFHLLNCTSWVDSARMNDVATIVSRAIEFHKAGDISQALVNYELALPRLEGNTKASLHGNAGALYMQKGEFEKAKEHFQLSTDTNPNNSQAQFNLAVLLTSKLNQHAKAIKHCKLAINLDPTNHKAQHLMGNILQSIGRPDEAEKFFVLAETIAREKELQPNSGSSIQNSENKPAPKAGMNLAGWDVNQILDLVPGDSLTYGIDNQEYELKCLSIAPYIFTIDNFISGAECDHIMNKATTTLEKSYIMGGAGKPGSEGYNSETTESTATTDGESKSQLGEATMNDVSSNKDAYRSSYNTWLTADSVLHAIQNKLALILGLPLPYIQQKSEDLQVVQYHGLPAGDTCGHRQYHGGQFKVHHDSSAFHTRYMTALIYLNDITHTSSDGTVSDPLATATESYSGAPNGSVYGGETWFPYATSSRVGAEQYRRITSVEQANAAALTHYEATVAPSESSTAISGSGDSNLHARLSGLKVKPRQGNVVIFFNHNPVTGELDPLAVHAGLPVRKTAGSVLSEGVGDKASDNCEDSIAEPRGELKRVGDKWVANYWIELDRKELSLIKK